MQHGCSVTINLSIYPFSPPHTLNLSDQFPSPPTSGALDYKQKKKISLRHSWGSCLPSWQASAMGIVRMCPLWYFPSISPWPDNVNPLMKLLCACPKPLSSAGNFLFSLRHTLPSVTRRTCNGHISLVSCLYSLFFLFLRLIALLYFCQFSHYLHS